MNGLSSISPTELTLLAVLIGFVAIASLDNDELNVIGNLLIGIGGLMVIAATQGAFISSLEEKKDHKDILQRQLDLLREEIESLPGRRHYDFAAHS